MQLWSRKDIPNEIMNLINNYYIINKVFIAGLIWNPKIFKQWTEMT